MSVFTGFAASAIGFTAWPLIVPVFFVLFGFDLYLTLFISLLIDCGNALMMVLTAYPHKRVDVKFGLMMSVFAMIWIAAGIAVGTAFIPDHQEMFRGAAGFLVILFGVAFILRGYRIKLKMNAGTHDPEAILHSPRIHRQSLAKYRSRLIYPAVAAMGFQVGLIGIGGGMGFAVFLMACLAYPTLTATGTAMMITFCCTLAAAAGIFFQIPDGTFSNPFLIQLIPLILAMSMIGTRLGAKVSYALADDHVNYLIGGIVLTAGLLAALQKFLLQFV
ncbi:MAG: TSUP family transporter [Desulfobacterales bacterium]|nr:TSUP family transporter [Desulfobacterales bacterium]